ncbi:MAG: polysaccharide deacetylase family protein [Pirellulaceae bacterium]|nr:polysaccharide deacetylase family protein [Pirellulaceae bacterium]
MNLNCKFLWVILALLPAQACVGQEKPRYLIIHSDDAGMSHAVNVATQAGLESGLVTSASIMVPCPWFKEFAVYAKTHPQFDYGIHLTLNSEWENYRWGPVASKDRVPSLIDPEGFLWDNVAQVVAHAKADEVKVELKAQIDKALAFGVPLSHLDTHMGAVVSRPDLVEVYVALSLEYNLPILFFRQLDPETARDHPALADRLKDCVAQLEERKLPILDGMLQFYGGNVPEQRKQLYFDEIAKIKPGVTQLIIHCGQDGDELRAITDSAARRDQDRALFTDPATRKFIKEQGIKLLSWKQFRELNQSRSK